MANCSNCGTVITDCLPEGSVTIVCGTDAIIKILLKVAETKLPFDLGGATEIEVKFPADAGGFISETLTGGGVVIIGSDDCGIIQVTLEDADTLLLKKGNEQSFEVIIDKGTNRVIAQFLKLLNVINKVFP